MAFLKKKTKARIWLYSTLALVLAGWLGSSGCSDQISDLVGPSNSGYSIGIRAQYGAGGLPASTSAQATIIVEVFDSNGQGVTTTASLTTTLGTLGTASLTITNGVGVTTLTGVATPGTASIVATVENISATTIVPIVNISNSVS